MKPLKFNIEQVELALRLHSSYEGKRPEVKHAAPCTVYSRDNSYLRIMDNEAHGYNKGSKSQQLCAMLADYYEHVGVKSLKEALTRLYNKYK
jgi:hypothetical protein